MAYIAGTVRATVQLAIARASSLCLRGPRRRDEAGTGGEQPGARQPEAAVGRVPQLADAGGVAAAGGPREAAVPGPAPSASARQPNPFRLRGEGM